MLLHRHKQVYYVILLRHSPYKYSVVKIFCCTGISKFIIIIMLLGGTVTGARSKIRCETKDNKKR
jgi:hypothetical protein